MNRKELIKKLQECNLDELSTETLIALCTCKKPEYIPEHLDFGNFKFEGRPEVPSIYIDTPSFLDTPSFADVMVYARPSISSARICSNAMGNENNRFTKMGNFGEWLNQFTTDCDFGKVNNARVEVNESGVICASDYVFFPPESAIKFALKIIQIAFSLKRKQQTGGGRSQGE